MKVDIGGGGLRLQLIEFGGASSVPHYKCVKYNFNSLSEEIKTKHLESYNFYRGVPYIYNT